MNLPPQTGRFWSARKWPVLICPVTLSFNEIVETLNQQGHKLSVKQVPTELFATFFPGAAEIAEMFNYFQAHTYLGSDSSDRIALATKIAGRQPTKFSTWARLNFPVQNAWMQPFTRCESKLKKRWHTSKKDGPKGRSLCKGSESASQTLMVRLSGFGWDYSSMRRYFVDGWNVTPSMRCSGNWTG